MRPQYLKKNPSQELTLVATDNNGQDFTKNKHFVNKGMTIILRRTNHVKKMK